MMWQERQERVSLEHSDSLSRAPAPHARACPRSLSAPQALMLAPLTDGPETDGGCTACPRSSRLQDPRTRPDSLTPRVHSYRFVPHRPRRVTGTAESGCPPSCYKVGTTFGLEAKTEDRYSQRRGRGNGSDGRRRQAKPLTAPPWNGAPYRAGDGRLRGQSQRQEKPPRVGQWRLRAFVFVLIFLLRASKRT